MQRFLTNERVRLDYSDVFISQKRDSMRLNNRLNRISGVSLRNKIENDYKINVTKLEFNDIKEAQNAIALHLPHVQNEFLVSRSITKPESIEKTTDQEFKYTPNKLTMNVDKWIKIHQRPIRRSQTSLGLNNSSSQENNPKRLKSAAPNVKLNRGERNSTIVKNTDNSRSRMELKEIILIDNITKKTRHQMQKELIDKRRNQSAKEFNRIVQKIKEFLIKIELMKQDKRSLDKRDPIKLYKY